MTLPEKSWILVFFVTTVFSSAWWPQLPSGLCIVIGTSVAVLLYWRYPNAPLLGTLLGVWVVTSHGSLLNEQKRILFQAGENTTIIAQVNSPFRQISHGYETIIVVEQINDEIVPYLLRPKIRLRTSINNTNATRFYINVNIKPIVGLLNEVGYDAEQNALFQGIIGVAKHNESVSWHSWSYPSIRSQFIHHLDQYFSPLSLGGWLKAISYGDRSGLESHDWQDLQRSGLAHLVTISGLHIGMAFAFGFSIGVFLRIIHPSLFFFPYFIGLSLAFSYAWLAGFTIPTQRAFVMCCLFILCRFALISLKSWRIFLICLAVILCIWPFSFFSVSFWLSFLCVVAVMIAVQQVENKKESIKEKCITLLKLQFWVTILILPASIFFFSGVSLSSYFYNLVFIPWFAIVVVPLMMISLLLTAPNLSLFGFQLIPLAWQMVELSLKFLLFALSIEDISWVSVPYSVGIVCLVLLILILLRVHLTIPASACLGLIGIAAAFCKSSSSATWQMDVFDIGHGLSVLITKDENLLLYDTGKGWESGSMAQGVIIPVIKRRGHSDIDALIISHGDNDHAGGYDDIITHLQPQQVFSSQTLTNAMPCIKGDTWQWNGLTVEMLWPPKQVTRAYNPHSCVVRVRDLSTGFSVLFAGDIEQIAEWILIREPEELDSDILVVPHHGSQSSSNPKFVKAVSPSVAIASTAKLNQWQLPNAKVIKRYQDLGANWLDTGNHGQITVTFTQSGIEVSTKRSNTFTPWYRQLLRNGVE